MAEEEEGEQTKINIHTPAPPSERIWMDVYLDQDGRLAKHDWCLDTGIIKNQGGEVAKPKGFYITILNKMKYVLEKELGRDRSQQLCAADIDFLLAYERDSYQPLEMLIQQIDEPWFKPLAMQVIKLL